MLLRPWAPINRELLLSLYTTSVRTHPNRIITVSKWQILYFWSNVLKHAESDFSFHVGEKTTNSDNAGYTQSFLPLRFFVHIFPHSRRRKKKACTQRIQWLKSSVHFLIFLSFSVIAGFSQSQSRFLISLSFLLSPCLSHAAQTHTNRNRRTRRQDTLKM